MLVVAAGAAAGAPNSEVPVDAGAAVFPNRLVPGRKGSIIMYSSNNVIVGKYIDQR